MVIVQFANCKRLPDMLSRSMKTSAPRIAPGTWVYVRRGTATGWDGDAGGWYLMNGAWMKTGRVWKLGIDPQMAVLICFL